MINPYVNVAACLNVNNMKVFAELSDEKEELIKVCRRTNERTLVCLENIFLSPRDHRDWASDDRRCQVMIMCDIV